MKFKNTHIPMIPVDHKDRVKLVESSRGLSTLPLITVCSQASTMSAIAIHSKAFGEIVEVNKEYVDELKSIAMSLMFEVNEILSLDMELVAGVINTILARLFPLTTIVNNKDYSQVKFIFSNTLIIPELVMDELSKNSYYSEKIYEHTLNLFDYSNGYSIKCLDGYLVIEKV